VAAPTTTTTAAKSVVTTTVVPPPPAQTVQAGEAGARIDGENKPATVERVNNQLVVQVGPLSATIGAVGTDGNPGALDDDGNVRLKPGDTVRIKVAGFEPGSTVEVWMFSTPVRMGTATVSDDGTVTGNFRIPANITDGDHRIVIVARTADGKPATLTVGVLVGDWKKVANITAWLIVLPIALAGLGALTLPATRRRRRRLSAGA